MKKILHVGWWTSEYRSGGSILHVEALMDALNEMGATNTYFCGGRYNLLVGKPYIKKWHKPYTEVYELVNSPNLIWSYDNLESHTYDRSIETLFLDVVKQVEPDIIHFHELESLSGCLLPLTRKLNIPYVVDIHNYWFLCPQRDLMDQKKSICRDWGNGAKCAVCRVLPSSSRAGWMYVGYLRPTVVGKICDQLVSLLHKKRIQHEFSTEAVTSETNNVGGDLYRKRRSFFISELNKAGAVIFPSKKSRAVYQNYGVDNPRSFCVLPLNANYSIIRHKQISSIPPDKIIFGYIGGVLPQKGVHILLEAFHSIQREKRGKCALVIYGAGDNLYEEELKQKQYEDVFFKGRYSPDQINDALQGIHVAVVPSLWEDCSPIVLNELKLSRTPILGSKIGGIEEAVKHGTTGYLFEPGNVAELAGYMKRIIDFPEIISEFMAAEDFTFDLADYMGKIRSIYSLISENCGADPF